MGAPAFGAAMSAAAMGFTGMLALPMFDTGAWNLSEDQIAMVHAGEMIIPADVAGGWRNAMTMMSDMPSWSLPSLGGYGAAANSNAPAATNGGGSDSHFHYHDHTASGLTPTQIIANRAAVAKAVKMAHRENMFAGSALGGML
jgi:hypothetical protein